MLEGIQTACRLCEAVRLLFLSFPAGGQGEKFRIYMACMVLVQGFRMARTLKHLEQALKLVAIAPSPIIRSCSDLIACCGFDFQTMRDAVLDFYFSGFATASQIGFDVSLPHISSALCLALFGHMHVAYPTIERTSETKNCPCTA